MKLPNTFTTSSHRGNNIRSVRFARTGNTIIMRQTVPSPAVPRTEHFNLDTPSGTY